MVVLFTKKYGKISAGSNSGERGKNKANLTLNHFTHVRYQLFKNRDSFNISSGEVIRSYFSIGEDVDKYMAASYVLEFTDRVLGEEEPAPAIFDLIIEFFSEISLRKSRYETLIIAYQVKILRVLGVMPALDFCAVCGSKENFKAFSIKDGGVICGKCIESVQNEDNSRLIYDLDFDIIHVLKYFMKMPLDGFRNLALQGDMLTRVQAVIKAYIQYHLDIDKLKSEAFTLE